MFILILDRNTDEVKCYRRARAIFKPVDHSEFHCCWLPSTPSKEYQIQGCWQRLRHDSFMCVTAHIERTETGFGVRPGDCSPSEPHRMKFGVGHHNLAPSPFKFIPLWAIVSQIALHWLRRQNIGSQWLDLFWVETYPVRRDILYFMDGVRFCSHSPLYQVLKIWATDFPFLHIPLTCLSLGRTVELPTRLEVMLLRGWETRTIHDVRLHHVTGWICTELAS